MATGKPSSLLGKDFPMDPCALRKHPSSYKEILSYVLEGSPLKSLVPQANFVGIVPLVCLWDLEWVVDTVSIYSWGANLAILSKLFYIFLFFIFF